MYEIIFSKNFNAFRILMVSDFSKKFAYNRYQSRFYCFVTEVIFSKDNLQS